MSSLDDFRRLSSLTPDELDRYRFVLDDPRTLPDLIHVIPDGVRMIALMHKYEWGAEKLNCADCGKCLHNRGAVVLLSNGKLCLIGSTCGPKRFPREWGDLEAEYGRAHKTAELRARSGELLERLPQDLQMLNDVGAAISAHDRIQSDIRDKLRPDFLRFHSEVMRGGGELRVSRRTSSTVRDQIREAEKQAGRHGRSAAGEYEMVLIGRLSCQKAIVGKSPAESLSGAIDELKSTRRELQVAEISNAMRQKLHKRYQNAWTLVREAVETGEAAFGFCNRANFAVMETWWAETPGLNCRLKVEDGILAIWHSPSSRPVHLAAPKVGTITPSEILQTLELVAPWANKDEAFD